MSGLFETKEKPFTDRWDDASDYVVCAKCKRSWMKRTVSVDHWVCPSCREPLA